MSNTNTNVTHNEALQYLYDSGYCISDISAVWLMMKNYQYTEQDEQHIKEMLCDAIRYGNEPPPRIWFYLSDTVYPF